MLSTSGMGNLQTKLKKARQVFNAKSPNSAVSYRADFSSLDALLNDYSEGGSKFDTSSSYSSTDQKMYLPSEKQEKAWSALQQLFNALSVTAEARGATKAALFKDYLAEQLKACEPCPAFYLNPSKELIFFTKFVDDVATISGLFDVPEPSSDSISPKQ